MYSNRIMSIFFSFFSWGRWFSKTLCNIWGWYVRILTTPYRGGWVVWKRPKTPLRNIKMAPKLMRGFHISGSIASQSIVRVPCESQDANTTDSGASVPRKGI